MQASQQPSLSQKPHFQGEKSFNNVLEQIVQNYGPPAKNIYEDIKRFKAFQEKLQKYDFPTIKFVRIPTESNVCAKILSKGVKAFKCHDCMYEHNSIMCIECFQQSQHKGHIYQLIQVYGGCCDCGDQQKWDPKGSCKKHSNSNILQEMKEKINPEQQRAFIKTLKFCFLYWFLMYNQAQTYMAGQKQKEKPSDSTKKFYKQAQSFGIALLNYLSEFNKESLISNIMTYNLLQSNLDTFAYPLEFSQAITNETPLYEIIFRMIRLQKCPQIIVNLFTQLFTVRQFRKKLTIVFIKLHRQNHQFAMSGYNHLSCQLLTSHKVIRQLVENNEIQPLIYTPPIKEVKSFEGLAHNFVRYYIDIEYLSRLYKQSAQIYLKFHIKNGGIPALGYYRNISYKFEDAVNYYGIEEIYIVKLLKILKVIKNSNDCKEVLEKGIQDLYQQISKIYQQQTFTINEDTRIKYLYMTQEITFALVVYTYFQVLSQNENKQQMTQNDKILRLIQVLNLSQDHKAKHKIYTMLKLLHNSLIYSGLVLGHPQTMQRFYTYFSFTFRKSLMIPSLVFYLYKLVLFLIKYLNSPNIIQEQKTQKQQMIQQQKQQLSSIKYLCQQSQFQKPFQIVEQMFKAESFKDDDQSIFDRRKKMIRLNYFLNFITQLAETDIHQLIIAMNMEFYNNSNKSKYYQEKLMKFYIQLLKNYKKTTIKQFKQTVDLFFTCDQMFEKFISTSKDIQISNGKICLKEQSLPKKSLVQQSIIIQQHPSSNNTQSNNKKSIIEPINTELNLYYYKSFKHKLQNIDEKQLTLITPTNTKNHFLKDIISYEFLEKLTQIASVYSDIIIMQQGKIKQRQSAGLGQLIVQIIKINRALQSQNKNYKYFNQQNNNKVIRYLKKLKEKKQYLNIFTDDIVRIICNDVKQNENQSIIGLTALEQDIKKQAEIKAQERKRKLAEKKSKKLAKFKQNQQKYQQKYSLQLKNIRQQMQQEQKIQSQLDKTKTCIICRQTHNQNQPQKSDLMLMSFMQLSDLYNYYLKGKTKNSTNCQLVFKTCGHYIHFKCHQKLNGNKQFALCQLCKSSVNCLFPVSVSVTNTTSFLVTPPQKLLEMYQKSQENQQPKLPIYDQIKNNFSRLYMIDVVLRQNCQNSFGKDIEDTRDIQQKLIESFITNFIMQGLRNYIQNSSQINKIKSQFFIRKQSQIYKNIIKSLKYYLAIQKQTSRKNKQHFIDKQRYTKILLQQQNNFSLEMKEQKQQNMSNKKTQKILFVLEKYLKILIYEYLFQQEVNEKSKKSYEQKLSKECVIIVEKLFEKLTRSQQEKIVQQEKGMKEQQLQLQKSEKDKEMEIQKTSMQTCPQLSCLFSAFSFYQPPDSLHKLVDQRGKCPNCHRFTNHIMICIICSWKGCRECKTESIFQHNNKKHVGNSIYIEADLGSVYYVSRKKYWIYPSLYEDYLGYPFHQYTPGMKLEKYTLNEIRMEKIKKSILEYDIENTIRYEEYNKKRTFTAHI